MHRNPGMSDTAPAPLPGSTPLRIMGFMTGTSLDAVDIAVLDTDGERITAFGPVGDFPLSDPTRAVILEAICAGRSWARGTPEPPVFMAAARAIAMEHFRAGEAFLLAHAMAWCDFDCLGVHGQTVLHERPCRPRPGALLTGRTVQLLDAPLLARLSGRPVVHSFRNADVAAGGEGAPLAPAYHAARAQASGLALPLAVLNIGGVANVTVLLPGSGGSSSSSSSSPPPSGDPGASLVAFDTGPGCGPLDSLMQEAAAAAALGGGEAVRCDLDGAVSAAGRPDSRALETLLAHPYFALPPPKSLDRYDLPAAAAVAGLPLADAAATLVAFTAEAVARGLGMLPGLVRSGAEAEGGRWTAPGAAAGTNPGSSVIPYADSQAGSPAAPPPLPPCPPIEDLIVCGGGRRNPTLMAALAARLGPSRGAVRVRLAEAVGWRGDALEAEAFAFLAARVLRRLPLSWPGTTGVPRPTTGGEVAYPPLPPGEKGGGAVPLGPA